MKFISTASHGYLKITHNQLKNALLKGYKPSTYSLISPFSNTVLLEEDCDYPDYINFLLNEKYKDTDDSEERNNFKKELINSIEDKYQNYINHNKYLSIPTSYTKFEKFIEKRDTYLSAKKGYKLISLSNEHFISTGNFMKNGKDLIVVDKNNKLFYLPFRNVKTIIKDERSYFI